MSVTGLVRRLRGPVRFGLAGGLGGLVGAVLLGEPLWAVLRPPPPDPVLTVSASPSVQVYPGRGNTFTVLVGETRPPGTDPAGLVTVRFEGLPPGLTVAPVTADTKVGKAELTARAEAAADLAAGSYPVRAVARAGRAKPASAPLTVEVVPAQVPAVDLMFALDVSASMDFAIEGIVDGIRDLAGELSRQRMDLRVGLVAFCHYKDARRPYLVTLEFDGAALTRDLDAFRNKVARLRAGGGADPGESSLDGVAEAARQKWRDKATRAVVLITDEEPAVPDRRMKTVKQTAEELHDQGIEQLHLVVRPRHRRIFTQLQRSARGQVFDLEQVASGRESFARLLPELGRSIAEAVAASRPDLKPATAAPAVGLQSSQHFAEGSGGRLLTAISGWSGVVTAVVCLALLAAHSLSTRGGGPAGRAALIGFGCGLLAGLVGGAVGQAVYTAVGATGMLGELLRAGGWAILGGLSGAGLAAAVPNLRPVLGSVGGLLGGLLGAVGFLAVTALPLSSLPADLRDAVGRVVGAGMLGFCIGLMMALVDAAFRRAWLEVRYGEREVVTVNLGPEPVKVGSARECTVWARGADPVAARYFIRAGQVICHDPVTGREEVVAAGYFRQVSGVGLTVRTSSAPPPTQLPTVDGPGPVAARTTTGGSAAVPVAAPLPSSTPAKSAPTGRPVTAKPVVAKPVVASPPAPPTAAADICPECGAAVTGKPGLRVCKDCGAMS